MCLYGQTFGRRLGSAAPILSGFSQNCRDVTCHLNQYTRINLSIAKHLSYKISLTCQNSNSLYLDSIQHTQSSPYKTGNMLKLDPFWAE